MLLKNLQPFFRLPSFRCTATCYFANVMIIQKQDKIFITFAILYNVLENNIKTQNTA